jgi:hypothetical protein
MSALRRLPEASIKATFNRLTSNVYSSASNSIKFPLRLSKNILSFNLCTNTVCPEYCGIHTLSNAGLSFLNAINPSVLPSLLSIFPNTDDITKTTNNSTNNNNGVSLMPVIFYTV